MKPYKKLFESQKQVLNYLKTLKNEPVNRKTYNKLRSLDSSLITGNISDDDEENNLISNYIQGILIYIKSEINTGKRLKFEPESMTDILTKVNNIFKMRNKKVYIKI